MANMESENRVNNVKSIPVHFRLKGSRTYIHGTDMYGVFMAHVPGVSTSAGVGALRMTIHRMASRQSDIVVLGPHVEAVRPPNAYAEFSCETPGGVARSYLIETGSIVTECYSYEEERIENLCRIDENTIAIDGDSGYAPIEVVVAMNKRLHNTLFPLNEERWMFTRIELSRPLQPADARQFCVTFLQRLGVKLSRSAIVVDGQAIGHIYFSAVPK
jgi:hypothetical protein